MCSVGRCTRDIDIVLFFSKEHSVILTFCLSGHYAAWRRCGTVYQDTMQCGTDMDVFLEQFEIIRNFMEDFLI